MWSAEVAEYCGSSILIFLFQGVLAVKHGMSPILYNKGIEF